MGWGHRSGWGGWPQSPTWARVAVAQAWGGERRGWGNEGEVISCGDMTGGIPEGHGLGRAGGGGGGGSEPAGNKDDRGGLPGWREGPSSEPPCRGSRPAAPTASPPPPPCGSAGRRRLPAPGDPPQDPRSHSTGGATRSQPRPPRELPTTRSPRTPRKPFPAPRPGRALHTPGQSPQSSRPATFRLLLCHPSRSRHPILLCPCMPLPESPRAGPVPPPPGPTCSGSPARPRGQGAVTSS